MPAETYNDAVEITPQHPADAGGDRADERYQTDHAQGQSQGSGRHAKTGAGVTEAERSADPALGRKANGVLAGIELL